MQKQHKKPHRIGVSTAGFSVVFGCPRAYLVILFHCYSNPLFYYCVSPVVAKQVKEGAAATSQAAFGIKKMPRMQLSLPSLERQAQIVLRIKSSLTWLDKIATEHPRAERLLPKLDQAILASSVPYWRVG